MQDSREPFDWQEYEQYLDSIEPKVPYDENE